MILRKYLLARKYQWVEKVPPVKGRGAKLATTPIGGKCFTAE